MKTKRKEQKNQKGITLIALVVTIVVLIILATVSIQAVFSDSGIIKQAERAREETKIKNYKEAINLHLLEARMELTNGNEEEVLSKAKDLVKGDSKFSKATVSEIVDSSFTVTTEERYKFVTTPNGVEYTGKDTSQPGDIDNNETDNNEEVTLTLKYVDQNGNELQEGYVETYEKNEIIQISALPITKNDEVYTADYLRVITENGENEWRSDGKLNVVSFSLKKDTEADIVYIINSDDEGSGGSSGGGSSGSSGGGFGGSFGGIGGKGKDNGRNYRFKPKKTRKRTRKRTRRRTR